MRLGDLDVEALAHRLRTDGIVLDFGPIAARVRSDVTALAAALRTVYGSFELSPARELCGITVDIARRRGFRRIISPQIVFRVDGETPFEPFPSDTHLPLLEWGLNWCIALRLQSLLLLHSGAVERDGCGIIFPALPGSGKSTLVAGLTARGFRLLSDEFGAIDPLNGRLCPIVRPIAVKNESIPLLASLPLGLGPSFPKTRKGTVAHVAPPRSAVDRRNESCEPRQIVFPLFAAGKPLRLAPIPKARAFIKLIANSFNYDLLGPVGFDAARRLIQECNCWTLEYGDQRDAFEVIESLASGSLWLRRPSLEIVA